MTSYSRLSIAEVEIDITVDSLPCSFGFSHPSQATLTIESFPNSRNYTNIEPIPKHNLKHQHINMAELPPPPYQEYDDEKLKPMDADIDVKSVSSGASSISDNDNGTRTLHAYHKNWFGREGKIYDSDKQTVLYEIAQRNRKPQLTVRDPTSQSTVGTLEFSNWARRMDADVRGNKFTLNGTKGKVSWKNVDIHYDSAAFGQAMTWKRTTIWVVMPITLVDKNEVPVARFEPVCAKKKFGRVQLLRGDLSQDQIDEVVFTGMAVYMDTKFYETQNAAASAS